MPFFRIILHAKGIEVPNVQGGSPAIGFFITRSVWAGSRDAAVSKAQQMVLRDWTTGKYAAANRGDAPALVVDSIVPASFLEHLRFKNTGHSFYAVTDDATV